MTHRKIPDRWLPVALRCQIFIVDTFRNEIKIRLYQHSEGASPLRVPLPSRRGHKLLVHNDEIVYCIYGEDIQASRVKPKTSITKLCLFGMVVSRDVVGHTNVTKSAGAGLGAAHPALGVA